MNVQPEGEPPREESPRGVPPHRRYWAYANRPYPGFGCLWPLILFLLICWLLSLALPSDSIWNWY